MRNRWVRVVIAFATAIGSFNFGGLLLSLIGAQRLDNRLHLQLELALLGFSAYEVGGQPLPNQTSTRLRTPFLENRHVRGTGHLLSFDRSLD